MRGAFLGGPNSILGSILGPHYLGKLTHTRTVLSLLFQAFLPPLLVLMCLVSVQYSFTGVALSPS